MARKTMASAIGVWSKSCPVIPNRWICLQAQALGRARLVRPARGCAGTLLGLMTRLILDHAQAAGDADQGGGRP